MPIYEIETDQGVFEIDADREPTQEEALQAIAGQSKQSESVENRGGTGETMSREAAGDLAAQRLVDRERAAGFRPGDLMTKAELQTLADKAGIPLGEGVGKVASTDTMSDDIRGKLLKAAVGTREAASQSLFGIPGAIQSVGEDLILNEAQKKILGSQALKGKAEESAIAGGTIGQIIPSRLVVGAARTGATLPAKIGRGMLGGGVAGGLVSGSGAIEEKGADITPKELILRAALGGGGGALIGGGIPAATGAFRAASKNLRESAEKKVSEALMPTTKNNKAIAERITPEILANPKETFAMTKEGLLAKTEAKKQAAADAIEDFGKLQGDTKTQPVLDALENLKVSQKHVVDGKVVNAEAVKHIDEVKEIIAQYGDSIKKESLRDIKRGFDQATYGQKGAFPNYSEKSLLGFKKIASDEIRELLAKEEPDLAKLNKQFNFWSNFNKVIGDTVERTKGQQGATSNVATLFGALSGNGALNMITNALTFRYITKAVQSPGWKLSSAHARNMLADALASQNPGKVATALKQVDKTLGNELRDSLVKVSTDLPEPKQQRDLSDFERQILLEQKIKKAN